MLEASHHQRADMDPDRMAQQTSWRCTSVSEKGHDLSLLGFMEKIVLFKSLWQPAACWQEVLITGYSVTTYVSELKTVTNNKVRSGGIQLPNAFFSDALVTTLPQKKKKERKENQTNKN